MCYITPIVLHLALIAACACSASGDVPAPPRDPSSPEDLKVQSSGLLERLREIAPRYRLDQPWDDMSDAPAVVRRHRGMVALALDWLSRENPLKASDPQQQLARSADLVSFLTEATAAIEAGQDFLGRRRGSFFSAYYSSADGSGQPFVIQVPQGYDRRRAHALIVRLHGWSGRPMPNSGPPAIDGVICVDPWDRGDAFYTSLGENDALEVIDYVRTWYNIDPNRIYIQGWSMGGRGTWLIASHYPDLFAAAAPVYGWVEGALLANLRHVPIFNQHGLRDWVVPSDSSRYAVDLLNKMGYQVVHKEFPEDGHGINGELSTVDWLLSFRRDPSPECVTLESDHPRRARAYWVAVREFADPHLAARVTARACGRGRHQSMNLSLENARVLELDLTRAPVDRASGLLVQAGNRQVSIGAPLPDRVFLSVERGRLHSRTSWEPQNSGIRPYEPGSGGSLYWGEPLMIVYGTIGSGEQTEQCRKAAERLSRHCIPWQEMEIGRFPVKADTEVIEEHMEHCNLLLIGGAGQNALVSRMADKLPITIDTGNNLSAGARTPVSLNGAGYRLLYYNPLAPHRLVFIVATDEVGEQAQKWIGPESVTGMALETPQDEPDLVVQSIDSANRLRMQFTHGWKWDDAPGASLRLPERYARSRELTALVTCLIREVSLADFAVEPYEGQENDMGCDPLWATCADSAIERGQVPLVMGRIRGSDLLDMAAKVDQAEWGGPTWTWVIEPAGELARVEPTRMYTVAARPRALRMLAKRKLNLIDAHAGPVFDHRLIARRLAESQ